MFFFLASFKQSISEPHLVNSKVSILLNVFKRTKLFGIQLVWSIFHGIYLFIILDMNVYCMCWAAQWEPLSPGHSFVLGEPVNFVAQTGSLLAGERLFVDSCYVTNSNSKDPNGMHKVDIISNYGCVSINYISLLICSPVIGSSCIK